MLEGFDLGLGSVFEEVLPRLISVKGTDEFTKYSEGGEGSLRK